MKFEDIQPYVVKAAWSDDTDESRVYYFKPDYVMFFEAADGRDRTAFEHFEVFK